MVHDSISPLTKRQRSLLSVLPVARCNVQKECGLRNGAKLACFSDSNGSSVVLFSRGKIASSMSRC